MLKYCLKKWDLFKDDLEERLKDDCSLNSCNYDYLFKLVVECILNGGNINEFGACDYNWNVDEITVIDNGDYRGTLIFIVPRKTYQPSEGDYLITYVGYGSCSGCDTLQYIQKWNDNPPTEQQLKDYMMLCKDMLCNMVKPYNYGWRYDELFETVEMEE